MKKITLILLALFMAAFLVPETAQAQANQWWYVSRSEGGTEQRNNELILRTGESFIYIYFRMDQRPMTNFNRIRINFTSTADVEVTWQCAYSQSPELYGQVWGSVETIGVMRRGPIETDFSSFNQNWYGGQSALIKSEMNGIVLRIVNNSGSNVTVRVTEVTMLR